MKSNPWAAGSTPTKPVAPSGPGTIVRRKGGTAPAAPPPGYTAESGGFSAANDPTNPANAPAPDPAAPPPEAGGWTVPEGEDPEEYKAKADAAFGRVWGAIQAEAAARGIDESMARALFDKFIKSGKTYSGQDPNNPLSSDSGSAEGKARAQAAMNADFLQLLNTASTNPNAQLKNLPQVTPDAGLVDLIKSGLGAGYGPGTGGTAPADPVSNAIEEFRASSGAHTQEQLDALNGLKAPDAGADDQQAFIEQLQEQASGGGPSAAGALFQLALGKSIAGQRAAASGVRGGSAAGASRNAGLQGADMSMQATGSAAALRAQEQQSAAQLLGTTLAQQRQQDIGKATAIAEIAGQIRGQDVASAGVLAGLVAQASELDFAKKQAQVSTALQLLQLQAGTDQQNISNLMGKTGLVSNFELGSQQLELQRQQFAFQKRQAGQQLLLGLLGTAGNVGSTIGSALIAGPAAPAVRFLLPGSGPSNSPAGSVTSLPPPAP